MPHRALGIICSSEGWGGLELNTLRLARWMRDRGWKVHLLCSGGAPISMHGSDAATSITTFAESGKPARAGQLRVIHQWVKRFKIRALLVPYNKDIAAASLYKRFYNSDIGLVYQQHMQVGVSKRDMIHTLRYAMIDVWVAPLQYLKDETIRLTRVKEDRIQVIPFGIEPEIFQSPVPSRQEARESLSLPQHAYIIGVLGRLDPKKGQDLVIKALARLQETDEALCHLLLMGAATLNEGNEYSRQLHSLVRELKLEDRVHFRPYDAEVLRFFRAIDILAMPSHGETFGMVTIEALAAGVPVIGTNRDGTREILGEGQYGYLFEREDVDDFCRKLEELRGDTEMNVKLKAARGAVLARYTKSQMVDAIDKLLLELVSRDTAVQ